MGRIDHNDPSACREHLLPLSPYQSVSTLDLVLIAYLLQSKAGYHAEHPQRLVVGREQARRLHKRCLPTVRGEVGCPVDHRLAPRLPTSVAVASDGSGECIDAFLIKQAGEWEQVVVILHFLSITTLSGDCMHIGNILLENSP